MAIVYSSSVKAREPPRDSFQGATAATASAGNKNTMMMMTMVAVAVTAKNMIMMIVEANCNMMMIMTAQATAMGNHSTTIKMNLGASNNTHAPNNQTGAICNKPMVEVALSSLVEGKDWLGMA